MIVVTGAAGFIGSCLVKKLNDEGFSDLCLVDDFSASEKLPNLEGKSFRQQVPRMEFLDYFDKNAAHIDFIFHLGARTDTTEKDSTIFDRLNLNYSRSIWNTCTEFAIPLIYASSAATYGLGELGYQDSHDLVKRLKPLNPYGVSKNEFDKWVLAQDGTPPFWAGLKFFNVYGPNEYHKGRMASVIFHTVRQIRATGKMKLFRSHRSDIPDGHQARDFVYVKDVVEVCNFFFRQPESSGLYNVGTGEARTFLSLANSTFEAMQLSPRIEYIDTPADIRDTYQYFTQAEMAKLRQAGYPLSFYSLEEGLTDYVRSFLLNNAIW